LGPKSVKILLLFVEIYNLISVSTVTRRLEIIANYFQKIPQKLSSQKKAKNIYNKAQFESPKHLQQTNFETFKVAKLAKNHPIWSPCVSPQDFVNITVHQIGSSSNTFFWLCLIGGSQ
jgi:hypothetical protein